MTNFEERISRLILRLIDVLLLRNPERTVMGVLLGIVFAFLTTLFHPVLIKVELFDITSAPKWGWIPLGILVVHLPMVVWNIVHKPTMNDEVDEIIRLIEKGNFTDSEKRQMYRNLIQQCISSVDLKRNFTETMQSVQQSLRDTE